MIQKRSGWITKISGNMVAAETDAFVVQNEVAYIIHSSERLKSEVIRIRDRQAEMQVFGNTVGIKVGEQVEFTGELLSVELGPGLLGKIYDGLQNPLHEVAKKCGFFLKRGVYMEALDTDSEWEWTPTAHVGDRLRPGEKLGFVPEKIFKHYITAPFNLTGRLQLCNIAKHGKYNLRQVIAQLKDEDGKLHDCFLKQVWPVK